ncbi:MAG: MATE family efflux transporter [Eubacterium sp.]
MRQQNIEQENPLGIEPIWRLIRKFAIPSVVAMLVNAIYNIVDQIFIQRGVGSNGNAATTVAFPLVTFTLAISLLIGVGGSSLAAIRLGENRKDEAEKIMGNAFLLTIITSVIIMLATAIFFEPLLKILGASDAVMPYAKDYTGVIMLGFIFMSIGTGMAAFVRTDGAPHISMIALVAGCGLNVILDPIFIFKCNMGVFGAALGTIISQFITACIIMWYLISAGNMKLHLKNIRINWKLSWIFCTLGLSSFITQFANSIVQISMNNLLQHYGNQCQVGGDTAMTAMGIVLKTNMILIGICVGIAQGAQPICGYNWGAANYIRVKKAYIRSVALSTTISILGWLFIQFNPESILSIYGGKDPAMIDFACKSMKIFMGGVCAAGFNIVSSHFFQSIGKRYKAFTLSMARQVIALIPFMYIFPLFMGLDGILYAGLFADIVSLIIGIILIALEMKSLNNMIQKNN